jgi:hypothetical protein
MNFQFRLGIIFSYIIDSIYSKCSASDIGLSYRSDHSPVSIVLKKINQTRGRGTWKFNNSLLRDEEFVKKVKTRK